MVNRIADNKRTTKVHGEETTTTEQTLRRIKGGRDNKVYKNVKTYGKFTILYILYII